MSKTAKGCLIVAACLVGMGLILIGVGALWWANNKDAIIAQARENRDAGLAFGEKTDNTGCLQESLTPHGQCGAFTCHVSNNLFFSACLENSRPNEGFCTNVPRVEEFVSSAQGRIRQCSDRSLSDNYCAELFGEIQKYCNEKPASPKKPWEP